jgi:predicted nucleic acid-binding protein
VAALVDTNVLVYRYDGRFPEKQRVARDLLRRGIEDGSLRVSHQSIVEFVAATTRPLEADGPLLSGGDARGEADGPILSEEDARREAEEILTIFPVLYPNDEVVRMALRGAAAYQLNWFDAHLWAYAEVYGLAELVSEDFTHDRLYGSVRIVNPFIS